MADTPTTPLPARKRLLFAVGVGVFLLAMIEGGARVVLLAIGSGEAPLEVRWSGHTQGATELKDKLYEPDERYFFRLRPGVVLGQTVNPRIFDVRTNAQRLRGPEISVVKPAGTLRVLCVGDSCTFGSGAGNNATYPAQLQRLLEQATPGRPVEVLNAGVPGFTSYQAMRYLETDGIALSPDYVVIAAGFNDSTSAKGGERRVIAEGVQMTDREYAETLRGPGGLGITRLVRRLTARPAVQPAKEDSQAAPPPAETWPQGKVRVSREEYREHLLAMIDICKRRGAKVMLVAWPILPQVQGATLRGRSKEIEIYQQIAKELAQQGMAKYLDGPAIMAGRAEEFIDIVHMSPAGYLRIAEAVAAQLEN